MQLIIKDSKIKLFIKNLVSISKVRCFVEDNKNVLLKLIPNFLLFYSKSNDFVCICYIPFEHNYQHYAAKINFKKLVDIFKNFYNVDYINIIFNTKNIRINTNSIRCILPIIFNDNEKINFNCGDIICNISISSQIFKSIINCVKFSIPNNDIRPFLNGICLSINKHCLKFISSDGYRLSLKIFSLSLNVDKTFNIIIPRNTIFEILKILDKDSTSIDIYKNKIKIKTGNYIFISNLVTSEFPDFNFLINRNFCYSFIILKNELLESCMRVCVFSNLLNYSINFFINDLKIIISSSLMSGEKIEENLTILSSNLKNIFFKLNYKYILDVLNIIDVEEIKISIDSDFKYIMISQENNSKFFYIIATIMMDNEK